MFSIFFMIYLFDFLFIFLLDDEMSVPDFLGSPYEFWVGANVPIGTSVGQIRINDAMKKKKNHIVYDLLHSYREGGKSKKKKSNMKDFNVRQWKAIIIKSREKYKKRIIK